MVLSEISISYLTNILLYIDLTFLEGYTNRMLDN